MSEGFSRNCLAVWHWVPNWPFVRNRVDIRCGAQWSLVLGSYVVVAVLTTWPLVQNLTSQLIGRTSDAQLHFWNAWWVQQALAAGQSPFFTNYLSFPYGVSLVTHNFAWFQILPWLILEPLLGGIAAYNFTILLSLVLCGLAAFWLTYDLLSDRRAAFIAGLIYMAWPYRLSQLDHPNLVGTFFGPIYFLFLGRLLREGGWRNAIWAGLALALTGYTRWQILIPILLMSGLFVISLSGKWWAARRDRLPKLMAGGILALLLLAPPLVLYVGEQLGSDDVTDVIFEDDEVIMSTDWLAYITPPRGHPQFSTWVKDLYDNNYYPDRTTGRRYPVYMGLVVLMLVAIAIVRRFRDVAPWLLMALTMMALATGLEWRIFGHYYDLPTLYELLAPFQIVRLMREPERYALFVALPVAVTAAYGLQTVLGNKIAAWQAGLIVLLTGSIILFEYGVYPAPMQNVTHDQSMLAAIEDKSNDGQGILNLPLRLRFSKEYMYQQTQHGRPIVQGHISREPEEQYQYIREKELFTELLRLDNPGKWMADLAGDGVKYIVLSKEYFANALEIEPWLRQMPAAPFFQDENYLVYETRPTPPLAFRLNDDLSLVSAVARELHSADQVQVQADVTWFSTQAIEEHYQVRLTALADDQEYVSDGRPLHADWPTTEWPRGALSRGTYTLNLPANVTADSIRVELIDATGAELAAVAELGAPARTILPAEGTLAGAQFGDALRLSHFHIEFDNETLGLEITWMALDKIAENLKIFVHLVDPRNGQIVAQTDTLPKQWTYPTVLWQPGEVVDDFISLRLDNLSTGIYQLQLGVYDADTGARQPISQVATSLQQLPSNRLLLSPRIAIGSQ